jgi:hypothetical protein
VSPPQSYRPGLSGADSARAAPHEVLNTRPGGPSAKTFHQAGSPNHQIGSKESANV